MKDCVFIVSTKYVILFSPLSDSVFAICAHFLNSPAQVIERTSPLDITDALFEVL
jgi:hypothetical protein